MEERNKTKIRMAVIGIGNIGTVHAMKIGSGEIPGMELVACCDINPQRLDFICGEIPGVAVYGDYQQLLQQPEVDGVMIAVPHPLHEKIALDALKAGKHTLVEKPISISVTSAKRMIAAAEKSQKAFGIMLNQRTNPLFAKARQIVQSGQLGEMKRSVWIVTNWYRTQAYYDSNSWRATWSGEGGGVLLNQAPHNLDLWQWICGMPVSISGYCDVGKYHDIETEDDVTIFARYANGATGTFIVSTGEYPGTNRLEISGTLGKLVLEDGKLKWWRLSQSYEDALQQSGVYTAELPCTYEELPKQQEPGHVGILKNFAEHILNGAPLLAPGQDGIFELAISNAAYLSAWQGSVPVSIPLDEACFDSLLNAHIEGAKSKKTVAYSCGQVEYMKRWKTNW